MATYPPPRSVAYAVVETTSWWLCELSVGNVKASVLFVLICEASWVALLVPVAGSGR
jgi:hypothetical protein